MPKIYVRVNPRSQISKRHRCAIEFTGVWKELDADDATRAALEEDPYLEVSDTPTVLVEVAATVQTAAPEAAVDPINPESATQQDSADAAQGDSEQAGTASATGDEIKTGGDAPSADAADTGADGEQPANTGEQAQGDPRAEAIKSAIAQLDPNNAEHWLQDGRPSLSVVAQLTGFNVLAAERDQIWAKIQTERSAG